MRHQKNNPKSDTSWNKVSGWYDKLVGEFGSDYHQNVIIPNSIKLFNPKKDENILDIACGQGVFSRKLASFGAKVTGIDASEKLIAIAKEHSKKSHNLSYRVLDAEHLDGFDPKSFDAASCIMAIQNIDHFGKVINGAGRILKDKGRILIVMNHPCFRMPRMSGWGFDEKRKIQYRRIDAYLSEKRVPIDMHPGHDKSIKTWTFHRPLSSYFRELGKNNFAVTALEEWITHRRTNETADNKSREEIPLFMALLAIKQ